MRPQLKTSSVFHLAKEVNKATDDVREAASCGSRNQRATLASIICREWRGLAGVWVKTSPHCQNIGVSRR